MRKELVDKIKQIPITRNDCEKFPSLIDIIWINRGNPRVSDSQANSDYSGLYLYKKPDLEQRQSKYRDTSSKEVKVSLLALTNGGYKYKDIKLLRDLFYCLNKVFPFFIENEDCFDPEFVHKKRNIYQSENEIVEAQENVLLRLNLSDEMGFFPDQMKKQLSDLGKRLPKNEGIINLYLDDEGLHRDIDGTDLIYSIKKDSDRFTFLTAVMKGPKRGREIALEGKKEAPLLKIDLNRIAKKKLDLPKEYDLVTNDGEGYRINKKYNLKTKMK